MAVGALPIKSGRMRVKGFKQFGGRHCETTALRSVLAHQGHRFSEEMLLGIGGGAGFFYMEIKQMPVPIVAARHGSPKKDFVGTICERLGGSAKIVTGKIKGRKSLVDLLSSGQPAIVYGDMAFLDYLAMPPGAHFGGHAFVVYGIDSSGTVQISDRGKKGVTATWEQLEHARGSKHKPFAPNFKLIEVAGPAGEIDLASAVEVGIRSCCKGMLDIPMGNIGLKGLGKWASRVVEWPNRYPGDTLLAAIVNTFVFIETGGTGGAAFRRMYATFLREAAEVLDNNQLVKVAETLDESAEEWSGIAEALLPDSRPKLAQIRELRLEKNRIFEEQPDGARALMVENNERVSALERQAKSELRGAYSEILLDVQRRILRVRDIESRAFNDLRNAMS